MDTTKGKNVWPDTVCPHYHRAVELIGRRWTGVVLSALLDGSTRFSELRDAIPNISDRMLSERLKELEADGIVERVVIPETPVRIEYHPTEKGRSLQCVVDVIRDWASEWVAGSGDSC
ncbi:MAG: winged helix-turn-helix transcriptional regulator [Rubrobacteraceae bacterium]